MAAFARGVQQLIDRVFDSIVRGLGFETHINYVVSLRKTFTCSRASSLLRI